MGENESLAGESLFFNRNHELNCLIERAAGNRKTPLAICGKAGVGKSALLRQFLHILPSEKSYALFSAKRMNEFTFRPRDPSGQTSGAKNVERKIINQWHQYGSIIEPFFLDRSFSHNDGIATDVVARGLSL